MLICIQSYFVLFNILTTSIATIDSIIYTPSTALVNLVNPHVGDDSRGLPLLGNELMDNDIV